MARTVHDAVTMAPSVIRASGKDSLHVILHNIHYAQLRMGPMQNRDPDRTFLELALLLLALAVAVQVGVVRGFCLPMGSGSCGTAAF